MFFNKLDVPPFTPYALRAYYEWAVDNSYTPMIQVDLQSYKDEINVPAKFENDKEIVFNISPEACGNLEIGNEYVDFDARFGGQAHHIHFPVENVKLIVCRECQFGLPMDLFPGKRIKKKDTRPKKPVFSEV